jgi:uncharacterized membrane-anchored protein YhcB (DUF1043 family)
VIKKFLKLFSNNVFVFTLISIFLGLIIGAIILRYIWKAEISLLCNY